MMQIMIPDDLYAQLQATAQAQGLTLDVLIQETLENIEPTQTWLTPQEEQHVFDQLDRLAHKNASIDSDDWGQLIIDMRDQ